MIRIASESVTSRKTEPWHAHFLHVLPAVQRQASLAFRGLPQEMREELIAEVTAQVVVAVKQLCDRGELAKAHPSTLAGYAIRRVRIGRKVGMKLNVRDISSEYCRLSKRLRLERLDKLDQESGEWLELLVEDRRAGPAEIAMARIDVSEWFQRFSPRDRQIASALAVGHSTGEVARRFDLSPARISQKRREFLQSWQEFQGEYDAESHAPEACHDSEEQSWFDRLLQEDATASPVLTSLAIGS